MGRAIVEKSVNGKFSIGLEYIAPDLKAGETISAVTATVSPVGGLTASATAIDGNEVKTMIESGVKGVDYTVQFKVTTSAGHIYNHPVWDSILVKVV